MITKYTLFKESYIRKDKEKYIQLILDYVSRKSNIKFYIYDEVWNIQKGPIFLSGILYLSLKSERGIRFNWIENDLGSELHSMDIWTDFKFETNPDYTLEFKQESVAKNLPKCLKFFENPKSMINTSENIEVAEDLEREKKRLNRMRNPQSISMQKLKISEIEARMAHKEVATIPSEKVNQLDDDFKIDVFKAIELYTIQVSRGKSNSLIISGDAGVGKTRTVKDTLESISRADYVFSTGTITTAGLYEMLFKNRSSLLVFDDCDAVFKDADSINILKGALDTYDVREISKLSKGNTFDSIGMDDSEIQEMYDDTGKLPTKFEFTGQIIFISNLPEDKFDKAILSRSLHVDVHLTKQELFERMKEIMKKLAPDVDTFKKLEALEYLTEICERYPTKFDMNIRTLIHSINLRANNEEMLKIGSKEEPVWKLLIKNYLVKTR
jgi:hypothetical protein